MGYLCETTSIEGFVQLLACNYLPHGYWFYVTGWVPEGKDPRQVDAKLIGKYDIDLPRATRSRRKRLGYANLHYLRHGRFFVLIATHGKHRFFEEEAACIRDIRRVPLRFAGYSISYRRGNRTAAGTTDPRWHSHVEIERSAIRICWPGSAIWLAIARQTKSRWSSTDCRSSRTPPCGGRCCGCCGV